VVDYYTLKQTFAFEISFSVDLIMSNSEMPGVQKIESVEYLIYDFGTIKDIDLNESIVDTIKNLLNETII